MKYIYEHLKLATNKLEVTFKVGLQWTIREPSINFGKQDRLKNVMLFGKLVSTFHSPWSSESKVEAPLLGVQIWK